MQLQIGLFCFVRIISSAVVGVNCSAVLSFALFVHVFSLRLAGGIIQSKEGVQMSAVVNRLIAFLLSKTDAKTTSRDQREWQRKQAEEGNFDRERSLLDAEVQHIKDSLGGIFVSDLTRNGQRRGLE